MKQQNTFLKALTILAITILQPETSGLFATVPPHPVGAVSDRLPLSTIRYIEQDDLHLIFEVVGHKEDVIRFRIADQFNHTLFDEKVQPGAKGKRFRIAMEGITHLHFESITKSVVQRKSFAVAYRLEERLMVTEMEK